MAYQNVTKQQIAAATQSEIDFSDILGNYPDGNLEQEQAESLQLEIVQKICDEISKIIDPDKEYPDLRF